MVIWLIGLSGAGKSAISLALQKEVRSAGKSCVVLDGDVIRDLFANDLSHSLQDRRKNSERICRFGQFLESQGVNVVCAILSIFHDQQDWNRQNLASYFEVFVDAEVEQVSARDSKGLYAKAKRGELTNVVGLDIPFPAPKSPDMIIRNDFTEPVDILAQKIFDRIKTRLS